MSDIFGSKRTDVGGFKTEREAQAFDLGWDSRQQDGYARKEAIELALRHPAIREGLDVIDLAKRIEAYIAGTEEEK